MNTRKGRGRSKTQTDTPSKDNTLTEGNNAAKKALFTPCRRLGLGRKRGTQNSPVLSQTPSKTPTPEISVNEQKPDVPSPSQSTSTVTSPSEEKPKSSASRRKKSSHPLKRTIDENKSEGNSTFAVILTPVLKKRKIELVDIFNSEFSQDSTKNNQKISDNVISAKQNEFLPNNKQENVVKSDLKTTRSKSNTSLKISLPLELGQNYLTLSDTLTVKSSESSDKNAVISTINNKVTKKGKVKDRTIDKNLNSSPEITLIQPTVSDTETKPIKKRKVREKPDSTRDHMERIEDVENLIPCSKIDKTPTITDVENKIDDTSDKTRDKCIETKNLNKQKPKSVHSNIIQQIVNDFDDDLDDDFQDFTHRVQNKLLIKNKMIVEPKKTSRATSNSTRVENLSKNSPKNNKQKRKSTQRNKSLEIFSEVKEKCNKANNSHNEAIFFDNEDRVSLNLRKNKKSNKNNGKSTIKPIHREEIPNSSHDKTNEVTENLNKGTPVSETSEMLNVNSLKRINISEEPEKSEENIKQQQINKIASENVVTEIVTVPEEKIDQKKKTRKQNIATNKKFEDTQNKKENKLNIVDKNGQNKIKTDNLEHKNMVENDFHEEGKHNCKDTTEKRNEDTKIHENLEKEVQDGSKKQETSEKVLLGKTNEENIRHEQLNEDTKKQSPNKKNETRKQDTIPNNEDLKKGANLSDFNTSLLKKIEAHQIEDHDDNSMGSIEQLSLLDVRARRKQDGCVSITEDSEVSSYYSTPTYSPIEETVRLAEDKDFWIQHSEEMRLPQIENKLGEESSNLEKQRIEIIETCQDVEAREDNNEVELRKDEERVVEDVRNEEIKLGPEMNIRVGDVMSIKDDNTIGKAHESENVQCISPDECLQSVPLRGRRLRSAKAKEKYNLHEVSNTERHIINVYPYSLSCPVNIQEHLLFNQPRVVLNVEEIEEYKRQIEINRRLKADEKIYRVNRTENKYLDKSKLEGNIVTRRGRNEWKKTRNLSKSIDITAELELKRTGLISVRKTESMQDFVVKNVPKRREKKKHILSPSLVRQEIESSHLIITRVEGCVNEDELELFNTNKTFEKPEMKNNKMVQANLAESSREESVFFTPPSSRSENDSDSNRNDFQTESEASPNGNSNPYGEGTSTKLSLKELSVTNLAEIIGLPPKKKVTEVVNDSKNKITDEDKEVEVLSRKSPPKKTPRGKQKKKTSRSNLSTSRKSNISIDAIEFDSDSEDDFQPKRVPIPSKNYLTKEEGGTKTILKSNIKHSINDKLNRTENFRISDSSSITVLHKGQCTAYVKSHDVRSRDEQPKQVVKSGHSSMIVEHHLYKSNQRISSIFDSVIDDPEAYLKSQETPPPRITSQPTRTEVLTQIKEIEERIKEKQAKLDRLKLISVYKRTHDLDNLNNVSLQIKKGCQEALLELAAVLRQRSFTPFDMGTLLDNMHIPHHVVGYNDELDEFT